jgi:hypothetical protein
LPGEPQAVHVPVTMTIVPFCSPLVPPMHVLPSLQEK